MKPLVKILVLWCVMIGSVAANPYKVKVLRVVDGDTIEIEAKYLPPELKQKLSVRISGIDTPEKSPRAQCTSENALAQQATEHTKNMIAKARKIEIDIEGWDKYGGRILGRVRADGQDVADSLIKAGFARPYHGEKKQPWC